MSTFLIDMMYSCIKQKLFSQEKIFERGSAICLQTHLCLLCNAVAVLVKKARKARKARKAKKASVNSLEAFRPRLTVGAFLINSIV